MGVEMQWQAIVSLVVLVLDVYALLAIGRSHARRSHKVAWILVVLLLPVVGFAVWWFAGPRRPVTA